MTANTQSDTTLKSKPEILQSWRTKLLILILCILSFVIGWTSALAHNNKNCFEVGGRVVEVDGLKVCRIL